MARAYAFCSGLPRSGSTLLCNILAQNPAIHATPTSGCLDVLFGIRNQWDQLVEHRACPAPAGRLRVLRAALAAYHDAAPGALVLDKSRGWLAHLEMLEEVLGAPAKVLVPVRAVPDILASFEKLHRAAAATRQPPGEAENYFQFQTVAGRCEYWLRDDAPLGLALNRVRDAAARGLGDRLHLVPYDALTAAPARTVAGIYDFLGLAPFAHDFARVPQATAEDDGVHGYAGLHAIRPSVEHRPSDAESVLGAEIARRYAAAGFAGPGPL